MSEIANMEGSKALARTLARKVQEYFRNPTHRTRQIGSGKDPSAVNFVFTLIGLIF